MGRKRDWDWDPLSNRELRCDEKCQRNGCYQIIRSFDRLRSENREWTICSRLELALAFYGPYIVAFKAAGGSRPQSIKKLGIVTKSLWRALCMHACPDWRVPLLECALRSASSLASIAQVLPKLWIFLSCRAYFAKERRYRKFVDGSLTGASPESLKLQLTFHFLPALFFTLRHYHRGQNYYKKTLYKENVLAQLILS